MAIVPMSREPGAAVACARSPFIGGTVWKLVSQGKESEGHFAAEGMEEAVGDLAGGEA